jgi:hypothetical protein
MRKVLTEYLQNFGFTDHSMGFILTEKKDFLYPEFEQPSLQSKVRYITFKDFIIFFIR